MTKEPLRWEPEILSGMTTEAIVDKLKELVPAFDLNSFVAKTKKYLSCEDLSEEEYYPQAIFSDTDEDFIWMACEELWKRLIPDRPAVEYVAEQLDNIVEEIIKAGEKRRWKEVFRRNREALDLICRHTMEETPAGRRLHRDFYEKLRQTTFYDFDSLFDDLIRNLMGHEEYERVIDIAGTFGDALGDDSLLDYKAESLFALGKKDEAERLYQEIIGRNPDNPWCLLHAGDCYVTYGEKDFARARSYYLGALSIAEKHRKQPDGKDELRAVYQRLIDLAHDTGDYNGADRYQRLLSSIEAKKVGRNDPCPCGSGKKYKKCCGRDAGTALQPPPFDRRVMERDLLALKQTIEEKEFGSVEEMNRYIKETNKTGRIPQWTPKTPLEQAQSLIFEALDTAGKKRLELAEQALKISPDCADAYVLLAEEKAQSLEEAVSLYEAGVKAGEHALGKKVFEEDAGHFWGMVETRPYMRARAGLAQCLWLMGKREEAVSHYLEFLRLNQNDNQGIRYLLAASLLEMGKIDALQELLGQYDEPTAAWLYTEALVAYIKQGDSAEARKLLKEALDYNPHVVPYLLGEKKLHGELPERIGFGDKDEAVVYAAEFGPGWHQTGGAVDWLASVSGKARGTWQAGKKPAGIPEVFLRAFESEDRRRRPKGQAGNEPEG
ncbi:MAG: tetratricopeptide repeat protein [Dehalococcoidia bacterium]|nr:tetratricopeptide repeat protein [Dehalococcoidia bacterium]